MLPAYDHSEITALAAATIAQDLMYLYTTNFFYFLLLSFLYERSSDGNIDEFMPTNDVGEILQGKIGRAHVWNEAYSGWVRNVH